MIEFDDKSTFRLEDPLWIQAFDAAFGRLEPALVRTLLGAAVDYFWAVRRQPDPVGGEEAWGRSFETKAALTDAVLGRLLKLQLGFLEPRADAFPQKAAEKAGELSMYRLSVFGKKGLLHRAAERLRLGNVPGAIDALELLLKLDDEHGEGWELLGILLQRSGAGDRARRAFSRASKLMKTPHFGRASCPKCGWIPVGRPSWTCDACGERFDAFRTRATCPRCAKTSRETACPACQAVSPHEEWWH